MHIPKQPPDTRTAVPKRAALKKSAPKDVPPDSPTAQPSTSRSAGGPGKRVKMPFQTAMDGRTGKPKYKGREESVEIGTREDYGYLRPDPKPGVSEANPEHFHTAEAKRKSGSQAAREHLTGGLGRRERMEAEADFRNANLMNQAMARPVKSLEAEVERLETRQATLDGIKSALFRPFGIEVTAGRSQGLEDAKVKLDKARTDLKAFAEEREGQKSLNDKLYDAVLNRQSLESGQREATGEQKRSKAGANQRFDSHTPGFSPAGPVVEGPGAVRTANLNRLMGKGRSSSMDTPQTRLDTTTAKAEFDVSPKAARAQSQPPPPPSRPIEIPGSGPTPPREPASEPGPSQGASRPIPIPRPRGRMSEPQPLRGYDPGEGLFPERGRSRQIPDHRLQASPSPSPDTRTRRGRPHPGELD